MNVRSIEWRAVVLPVAFALAATVWLAWFNFVQIPTTERYLNERNLRLLRTIGGQIKARVDNFDQAIDNALDSLNVDKLDKGAMTHFGEYVRLFAPEIEIVAFGPKDQTFTSGTSAVATQVLKAANDPPRIMLERDEGRTFLYLGYKHGSWLAVARVDIEKVVAEYFPAGNDFDALLLVGSDGRTIVQRSEAGIDIARIDRLKLAPLGIAAGGSGDSKGPGASSDDQFASLRTTSTVRSVSMGGAAYQIYMQPIQLSLPGAKGNTEDVEPEEWTLSGLVAADHLRAASSSISYTYTLWLAAALAGIFIAIPLLKLQLVNVRERLRRTDGVMVAATAFLAAAALSFLVLDLYQFGVEVPNATDRRLAAVAEGIERRLQREVAAIDAQMTSFRRSDTWKLDLKYDVASGDNNLSLEGYRLKLSKDATKPGLVWLGDRWGCEPRWACRDRILSVMKPEQIAAMPYPFLDLSTLNDMAGAQRIKWTTSAGVTPFVNIRDARVPYFERMKRARLLAGSGEDVESNGVKVFLSPNTGKRVTVFWKSIADEAPDTSRRADLIGQTLSANPVSLDQPVLPANMQFAVVSRDGLVLFHSDPGRSLKENFIRECENSRPLKSALLEKASSAWLTAPYRAQPHRLFVKPLNLVVFDDPGWWLIVFQDTVVPETTNLFTLILGIALFGAYGVTLAIGWAVAAMVAGTHQTRWLWPDPAKGNRYRIVALVNLGLAAVAIAGIYLQNPTRGVLIAAAAVAAAIVANYLIVTSNRLPLAERPSWQRDFLFARTTFLLILSAVPAAVCFHVSYSFESLLAARQEQMRQGIDSSTRESRILRRAPLAGLCGQDYENGQGCPNLQAFLRKRQASELEWARGSGPESDATGTPTTGLGGLEGVLGRLQLPINDVSVDLTAVASMAPATAPLNGPSWWWIAVVPVLLIPLHLLTRFIAERLFALTLYPPSNWTADTRAALPGASLLLIGPPGSGKTARLRDAAGVRTFDIRTMPPGACTQWFSGAVSSADPDAIVGFDHLEHRLDDPKFRDTLLDTLEDLLFRQKRTVWVASTCDPIEHLREIDADPGTNGALVDFDRWSRVLQSFHKAVAGIDEDMQAELGAAAEPYYRALWTACSIDEKLALRHLADEGIVNPHNQTVVLQLMRKGLIVRRDGLRVMSATFEQFVAQATPAETIDAWEHFGVRTPWASIRTALLLGAVACGGFLILTEGQLVGAWFGAVPALLPTVMIPAVPTVINLLASRVSKSAHSA